MKTERHSCKDLLIENIISDIAKVSVTKTSKIYFIVQPQAKSNSN